MVRTLGPNPQTLGMTISVRWKNSGGTVAKNVHHWLSVKWLPADVANSFDFSKPLDPPPESPGIPMVPGEEQPTGGGFIPVDDVAKTIRMDGAIYAWGRADYMDIYPDSPPRYRRFCYEVSVNGTTNGTVNDPSLNTGFRVLKSDCFDGN